MILRLPALLLRRGVLKFTLQVSLVRCFQSVSISSRFSHPCCVMFYFPLVHICQLCRAFPSTLGKFSAPRDGLTIAWRTSVRNVTVWLMMLRRSPFESRWKIAVNDLKASTRSDWRSSSFHPGFYLGQVSQQSIRDVWLAGSPLYLPFRGGLNLATRNVTKIDICCWF